MQRIDNGDWCAAQNCTRKEFWSPSRDTHANVLLRRFDSLQDSASGDTILQYKSQAYFGI